MWLKLLTDRADAFAANSAGDIIELPDDEGERLIASQQAEAVTDDEDELTSRDSDRDDSHDDDVHGDEGDAFGGASDDDGEEDEPATPKRKPRTTNKRKGK